MALPTNLKYGIVTGKFITAKADNNDVDREPQIVPVPGVMAEFTPDTDRPVITDAVDGFTIFLDTIYGVTNAAGILVPADPLNPDQPDPTQTGILGVPLIAPASSAIEPANWTWRVKITTPNAGELAFSFPLTDAGGDLASLIPATPTPGTDLANWTAIVSTVQSALNNTLAARDEALDAVESGTGGAVDSVNGQTGVIVLTAASVGAQPAGSYAAASHTHASTGISDSTTIGRSVLTAASQAAARTAIDAQPAGSYQAAGSYAAASHTHTATAISDSTAVGRSLVTAVDAPTARGAISAADVAHTHVATGITDSTATGRSVLTAATAAAARTALGISDPYGFGNYPHIFYNGTTWPAKTSGVTIPTGYTGIVIWDSSQYPGAPTPSGMVTNDLWWKARA